MFDNITAARAKTKRGTSMLVSIVLHGAAIGLAVAFSSSAGGAQAEDAATDSEDRSQDAVHADRAAEGVAEARGETARGRPRPAGGRRGSGRRRRGRRGGRRGRRIARRNGNRAAAEAYRGRKQRDQDDQAERARDFIHKPGARARGA